MLVDACLHRRAGARGPSGFTIFGALDTAATPDSRGAGYAGFAGASSAAWAAATFSRRAFVSSWTKIWIVAERRITAFETYSISLNHAR